MNSRSLTESVWQLLHQTTALLNEGGFAEATPPLPAAAIAGGRTSHLPSEGYDDLAARYAEHLAFGATWPVGVGSNQPLALLLCEAPLSPEAVVFVRSWFENPKVNLVLATDFFVQSLPTLSGDKPPFQALARDLCALLHPKVILSLGPGPAQRLLGAPLSLETLRGSDYRFDKWTMVTTLDPELFADLSDAEKAPFKGQVWRDLQRLLGKLRYG